MTRFERWSLWTSTIATAVTGLGFLWAKYLVTPMDGWSVVNHPLEPWFLKLHILAAPFFVFAVGLVTTRHILPHLRRKEPSGRRSGLIMVGTLLPMVLSGYLIQVVSRPSWATPLLVLHIGTGCAFLVGYAGHRGRSRRITAASTSTVPDSPPGHAAETRP